MQTPVTPYHIFFDESLNAVVMKWRGYANSLEFREGTELMLNCLIRSKASKVLADIKDMTLIGSDDQQWLHTNFLPRAISFGFRVIAIVRPDSYFNKVAVESISYKADKTNLTINFFDNTDSAVEWLNSL